MELGLEFSAGLYIAIHIAYSSWPGHTQATGKRNRCLMDAHAQFNCHWYFATEVSSGE